MNGVRPGSARRRRRARHVTSQFGQRALSGDSSRVARVSPFDGSGCALMNSSRVLPESCGIRRPSVLACRGTVRGVIDAGRDTSWSRSWCWMLLVVAGRRLPCRATVAVRPRATNKGRRYPADPPTVEEIVLVMRRAGDHAHGRRLRGLIVVMWRAGLRISETLALTESDLDADRGAILVRHGKGDKRREVGMDQWGWELLCSWLAYRVQMPRSGRCSASSTGALAAAADDDGRPPTAAAHRCEGGSAPPIRSAPAASRARGRDAA